MIKNVSVLFLILFFFIINVKGQTEDPKYYKNNVNIEFFGSGIGYSLNYERIFSFSDYNHLALSGGVCYFFLIPTGLGQVSFLYGQKHIIEIGAGFAGPFEETIIPSLRAGYRYDDLFSKGIVVKVLLTPTVTRNVKFKYPFGIAVGYSF
ncbi:MAG: hypothetical protein JEZ09_06640 [Salinivirgaceae bacterium]|nr:hypothetical protein [Salinivirgaceae bacterium]